MRIPFIKAQGAGNDFIIIDKNADIIAKSKKLIKFLKSIIKKVLSYIL